MTLIAKHVILDHTAGVNVIRYVNTPFLGTPRQIMDAHTRAQFISDNHVALVNTKDKRLTHSLWNRAYIRYYFKTKMKDP